MGTRGPWTTTLPDLAVLYRTHTMPPKPNQTTRAHSSSTYTPPSLSSAAGVCMGHKPLPALPHWLSSPSHQARRLTCTCSVTSSWTASILPPAYVCLSASASFLRDTPSVLCSVPYFLIFGSFSLLLLLSIQPPPSWISCLATSFGDLPALRLSLDVEQPLIRQLHNRCRIAIVKAPCGTPELFFSDLERPAGPRRGQPAK